MSIIPTRASVHRPPAPSGGRFGVGTMAGIGVLAGLCSAVLALIGQARSATRSIEALAVEAALADGTLVPPAVPVAAGRSNASPTIWCTSDCRRARACMRRTAP